MRVLAIIQAWDQHDPIRGFTVDWMEELAQRVEHLTILTLEQRQPSTRSNITIYSLGKEDAKDRRKRLGYLRRWHHHMCTIFREAPPDVIFTHMAPIYSVLAFPYAWPGKIPIVTWYLHCQKTIWVRLAYHVSRLIVSATKQGFPISGDKVCAIGHGILTEKFVPPENHDVNPSPFRLLTVGRISPSKRVDLLIEALALFTKKQPERVIHFTIVGGPSGKNDEIYIETLQEQIESYQLQHMITFEGAIPFSEILVYYQHADCFINISETGGIDKVVLEAMSCGLVVIANPLFTEILGEELASSWVSEWNAEALCARLIQVTSLSASERRYLGKQFRQIVVQNHNLEGLCKRLVKKFHDLIDSPDEDYIAI